MRPILKRIPKHSAGNSTAILEGINRRDINQSQLSPFSVWLFSTLFVMASIGYPLSGALTTIFTPGTQTISLVFRSTVIAVSFLLLLIALYRGQTTGAPWLIIIFFLAGSARIYYDNFYTFIPDADKIGLYFFGIVVIPALVLAFCKKYFDPHKILIVTFYYNATICALVSYINFSGIAGDADLSDSVGRLFFESLNPTLIAYSAFFAIISGYLLARHFGVIMKTMFIIVLMLGLNLMTLALSRGPWIVLILCVGYIAMQRRSYYLMSFMLIAGISIGLFLSDSALEPLKILDRFSTAGIDESSRERIFAMQSSFDAMLAHPILGIAYVDPIAMFYPHNMLIESGMALGLGGAALMFIIQIQLFRASLKISQEAELIIGIFIIEVLISAYLSGSIWQSADFWCVAAIVLGGTLDGKIRRKFNQVENR